MENVLCLLLEAENAILFSLWLHSSKTSLTNTTKTVALDRCVSKEQVLKIY